MKSILFMLAITLTTPITWASGDRVGNGGNVVKCGTSLQMLDLYEYSKPLKSFQQSSYKDIVSDILKKLTVVSPAQAKQYIKQTSSFYEDVEFRKGIALVEVDDSKHVFQKSFKGCEIIQLAIRKNAKSKVTKQFIVDADIWEELSETDKAALVLHEVIYQHFFKLGDDDSKKSRILTGYLFSEDFAKATSEEYWDLIRSFKIPLYKF